MRAANGILLSVAGVLLAGGLVFQSSTTVRADSPPDDPMPALLGRLQDRLRSTLADDADPPLPGHESLAQGEGAQYRLFVPSAATDTQWAYHETLDPDEPDIERNDIEAIRIAVSDSRINVSIHSASPEGFSFEANDLGVTGAVAVSLIGMHIAPDGTLFVTIFEAAVQGSEIQTATISADSSTHDELPEPTLESTPWAGAGQVIKFTVPRTIFGPIEEVAYAAVGADVPDGFDPTLCPDDCVLPPIDLVPDYSEEDNAISPSFPLD